MRTRLYGLLALLAITLALAAAAMVSQSAYAQACGGPNQPECPPPGEREKKTKPTATDVPATPTLTPVPPPNQPACAPPNDDELRLLCTGLAPVAGPSGPDTGNTSPNEPLNPSGLPLRESPTLGGISLAGILIGLLTGILIGLLLPAVQRGFLLPAVQRGLLAGDGAQGVGGTSAKVDRGYIKGEDAFIKGEDAFIKGEDAFIKGENSFIKGEDSFIKGESFPPGSPNIPGDAGHIK